MDHMKKGADHTDFMQEGMHHTIAKGVTLTVAVEAATRVITLREGPMSLPAHTGHMTMAQPPDKIWVVPFDGWLLAYHPSLVTSKGDSVPGRVLRITPHSGTSTAPTFSVQIRRSIFSVPAVK